MLFIGDYSYETGYRAGLDIIKSKKITAVFAANDLMAYDWLNYFIKKVLRYLKIYQ